MPPSDLSSLEWEADGEMSAQDTWDLVTRLAKVEEQEKASSLLQLSSKHSHSKSKKLAASAFKSKTNCGKNQKIYE